MALPISKLYSKLGWSVIPVGGNKKSLVPWKEFTTRKASEEETHEWAERFNDAGIAVVTGSISRLIVLDADGQDAVDECERLGICKTPTVRTPRNGKHYYFSLPRGVQYKNAAKQGESKAIDVRCENGFVVAPNTRGKNGKLYEWEYRPNKVLIAKAPVWLIDMLTGLNQKRIRPEVVHAHERQGRHVGWVGRLPGFLQELVYKTPVKGTRSDNDFSVILALLAHGADETIIRDIFAETPIGQKYRQEGDRYLNRTIDEAIDKLRLVSVKYADLQTYGTSNVAGQPPGARLHLALEVEDESERGRLIRCGLTVPDSHRDDSYRARWNRLFDAVDVPAPSTLEETASVRSSLLGKKMRVQLGGSKHDKNPIAGFYRV